MDISFEAILFYLVLIDAITANISAWTGLGKESFKKMGGFSKYFPIARGWTTYYLILVLWVGYGLMRLGVIG